MNGAENIKNKILEEAKKEAEKLVDEGKKEEEKINEKNKKAEDDYAAKRNDEIDKAVKLFKDKTLAQSRLKVKRDYLDEREKIIGKFLEEGLKSISHSSKDYESYLKQILDKNLKLLSGEIKVYCNKGDKALAKKLVGDKAAIEAASITGGLIFEDSNGLKIDESLESKMERIKDKLRQRIVKKIA